MAGRRRGHPLDQAPEVQAAVNRLHRLRRRHGDQIVGGSYLRVHNYLADDWRGTGLHQLLVQRWVARQHRAHPTAHPDDEFVRSRTQHWSMLPETICLVVLLVRADVASLTAGGYR